MPSTRPVGADAGSGARAHPADAAARALWRSPALHAAAMNGLAGLAFAGANLVLARILPVTELAYFAAFSGLLSVGMSLAPLGADGLVNRGVGGSPGAWLARGALTCAAVGAIVALVGAAGYRLAPGLSLLLGMGVAAGGLTRLGASRLQRAQRFRLALLLLQGSNFLLLAAALGAALVGFPDALGAVVPAGVFVAGWLAAAVLAWRLAWRADAPGGRAFAWGESLSYAGIRTGSMVLLQLERLLLPHLLPLSALATYAVLAAVAGAPFRILHGGVGYTLVSRLPAASTPAARRGLAREELRVVLVVSAATSLAVALAAPLVARALAGPRYSLPAGLVAAAIVTGNLKVLNAFVRSIGAALAQPAELARLNRLGWIAIGAAAVASVWGRELGLAGVIYGVGCGWLLHTLLAARWAARHLRPGA